MAPEGRGMNMGLECGELPLVPLKLLNGILGKQANQLFSFTLHSQRSTHPLFLSDVPFGIERGMKSQAEQWIHP